jgi:hypothetical protein
MVVYDTSVLIDLFNLNLKGDRRLKLDGLQADLVKSRTKIIIPAPAYAEFMTRTDKARDQYIALIQGKSVFKVEPFGDRAALECSIMLGQALSAKERRAITKTKLKFDWQIVAVAKALSVSNVYTSDPDIVRCAKHAGLTATMIDDLPIPDSARQHAFSYEQSKQTDSTNGETETVSA